MENIIIRNIKKKDIHEVVDIQINGWKTAYKGIIEDEYLDSMNKQEKIDKREKDYMKNGFIIAELNNDIVGFCRYIDNNSLSTEVEKADCELIAIYVKPNLKYKGIGTKLFQYVKNEFIKKEKNKMILWCLKDNEASKKFYKKMGGTIICERKIAIGNKEYQEVCFLYNI